MNTIFDTFNSCLPRSFIFLSCLIPPALFPYLYHLFFLPEPVSNTHETHCFFSVDSFILFTIRLTIKILSLGCSQFFIESQNRIKFIFSHNSRFDISHKSSVIDNPLGYISLVPKMYPAALIRFNSVFQ